jgi:hypothetical protein
MVAVPEVEEDVLIAIVTESPALKEMPWKLTQAAGNHSYQAEAENSQLCLVWDKAELPLTAIRDLAILHGPVHPALEDSLLAGPSINTDPLKHIQPQNIGEGASGVRLSHCRRFRSFHLAVRWASGR